MSNILPCILGFASFEDSGGLLSRSEQKSFSVILVATSIILLQGKLPLGRLPAFSGSAGSTAWLDNCVANVRAASPSLLPPACHPVNSQTPSLATITTFEGTL